MAYPGSYVSTAPSTDKFFIIQSGNRPEPVCENAAKFVHEKHVPYFMLEGEANPIPCSEVYISEVPAVSASTITFIDTPGLVDNEDSHRTYDLVSALAHAAASADLVVLVLDVHKPTFTASLGRLMKIISPLNPNLRFVLNKADSISEDDMLNSYGALLWSARQWIAKAETPRVYLVSCQLTSTQRDTYTFGSRIARDTEDLRRAIFDAHANALFRRVATVRQKAEQIFPYAAYASHRAEQYPYIGAWLPQSLASWVTCFVEGTCFGKDDYEFTKRMVVRANILLEAENLPYLYKPNIELARDLWNSLRLTKGANFPWSFAAAANSNYSTPGILGLAHSVSHQLDVITGKIQQMEAIGADKKMRTLQASGNMQEFAVQAIHHAVLFMCTCFGGSRATRVDHPQAITANDLWSGLEAFLHEPEAVGNVLQDCLPAEHKSDGIDSTTVAGCWVLTMHQVVYKSRPANLTVLVDRYVGAAATEHSTTVSGNKQRASLDTTSECATHVYAWLSGAAKRRTL